MKRRVRFALWLFERSRSTRVLFVLATWPFVYVADQWRGYDPPARLSDALHWVKWGTRECQKTLCPACRLQSAHLTVKEDRR